MIASAVTIYIADKLLSQFIKEEGYGYLKKVFFPTKKYKVRIEELIVETINEYSILYPIEESYDKIPFYESEMLFNLLNNHILFKTNISPLIIEEFKKNEKITIPNEQQLELFYKIFTNKINSDKLLRKIHIDESYKNEIFEISGSLTELHTLGNKILKVVNKIADSIDENNSPNKLLRNRFHDDITIDNLYSPRGITLSSKLELVSDRKKLVAECQSLFEKKMLVHLYGNISMGKTQLAIGICEGFKDKFWIDLKDINTRLVIKIIIRELSIYFKFQINGQDDVEKLISLMPVNSILVLDDLPKLDLLDMDIGHFKNLLELLEKAKIKILTTSNYALTIKVKEIISLQQYTEKSIPFLDEEEIQDILVAYGADASEAVLIKSVVHRSTKGHPAIVNAFCRYMVDEKWQVNESNIDKIFTGDFSTDLDEDTFERILKTISSKQAKDLLYRLKQVIGYISKKEIETLSALKPVVNFPFEKITVLKGLWLQSLQEDLYEVSPLIKRLRHSNLTPFLYKAVNNSLGELILQDRKINQVNARRAILYFINAKSYNRAGFILSLVLEQALKDPDLYFNWGFDSFWVSEIFPSEMDLYLQSVLRYFQISISLKNQKDTLFLVEDLENIVEEASKHNINIVHAAFLLSNIHSDANNIKSISYLILAIKQSESFIDKQSLYANFKVSIESLLWGNLLNVKSIEEFDVWYEGLDKLTPSQVQNSLLGDFAKVSCLIFCSRIYEQYKSVSDWEGLLQFYEKVINKVLLLNSKLLIAYCLKFEIRCICSEQNNFEAAIGLFEDKIINLKNDNFCCFILNDELGRQLFYLGKSTLALGYLHIASNIDVPKIFTEKIDTFLVLNQIVGDNDKKLGYEYSVKAFELQKDNEYVDEVLSAKIIGELSISSWDLNNSIHVFYLLEEGIEKLILSYRPLDEFQGTIIRYGHVLNYFYHKILKIPLKDIDGAPYGIPYRGFFSKSNSDLLKGGFYYEQRKFVLTYLMLHTFEEIEDIKLAKKWAYICIKVADEEILNPFISVMTGISVYLVLDDKFEEAVLLDIKVLNSINSLNKEENIHDKLGNKRLTDIISGRPLTIFNSFDLLIFEHVVNLVVIKVLWDYVKTNDDAIILKLKDILGSVNNYFDDKQPLEIIILACDSLLELDHREPRILTLIDQLKVDHELRTQVNLILYLFEAIISKSRKALQLHLALIQRLELVTTKTSTNIPYKYLVTPFLVEFWNKRIENDKAAFFQYDFMLKKGIPKIENIPIISKVKNLFRILTHHLEVEPTSPEQSWIDSE